MTIDLTPQPEALLRQKVAGGPYATVGEVLDASRRP
jgi:hypothetical protein